MSSGIFCKTALSNEQNKFKKHFNEHSKKQDNEKKNNDVTRSRVSYRN